MHFSGAVRRQPKGARGCTRVDVSCQKRFPLANVTKPSVPPAMVPARQSRASAVS